MIEKEVLVDVMDDFVRWMWNKDFSFTPAEADTFLAEYGINRQVLISEGMRHGVVLSSACFVEDPPTVGQRIANWIFG